MWSPFEAVAQDSPIDMAIPDCLAGGGGGEGGAGSSHEEIIKRFTELSDEFLRNSDRRIAECFSRGRVREVPSSTPPQECRFHSFNPIKESPWLKFESGTPITGDESGIIDNRRTWISMRDPISGKNSPIPGLGFGYEVHTYGSTEQSFDTLKRDGSVALYYHPLRLMLTCGTDMF
jgi:hypothetical protein